MEHPKTVGSALSEREVAAVLASLHRQRGPSTALSIAQRSGLSTLVVVPALGELVDEGLVSRRAASNGPRATATWSYQLTVQGRRAAQARS